MSTTVPERPPLGGSTLNRKWYLDVDTDATGTTPTWVGVFGITEFQDSLDSTLQDDSDFDSEGYKSQTKTAEAWALTFKAGRKVKASDATAYDEGQEFLRLKAGQMGPANSAKVRWYEMTPDGPRVEAYEGLAAVAYAPDGGGMDALSMATFTLTGQGKRVPVSHPDVVTP